MPKQIVSIVGLMVLVLCSVGAVSAQSLGPDWNFDRPGSDYVVFDTQSASSCSSACRGDAKCRAWAYVKPGVQGPRARCYLKDRVPPRRPDSCCTSGAMNPLYEIQACRRIGNIQGQGSVTCVEPGGRRFGREQAFDDGAEMFILVRLRRLPVGSHRLKVFYERRAGARFVDVGARELAFKNELDSWAYWFPVHFTTSGEWRTSVALTDITGFGGGVLGSVTYRVGWGWLEG